MTQAHAAISRLLSAVHVEQAVLRRAKRLYAYEHAPDFNMVDLLGPNENALSGVIRWLLDEQADHGQGDAFRRLFFELFPEAQRPEADWTGATARCEVSTAGGGRMDILLETRDARYALVIENKPWAVWQPQQLEGYWNDQDRGQSRCKVIAFVGGVADAQAIVAEHWARRKGAPALPSHVLGFGLERVATWLEACAGAARPFKVVTFIRDLAAYSRGIALEGRSMTDNRAIADMIASGGVDQITAAVAIQAAYPELMRSLAATIREQLVKQADGSGWEVTLFEQPTQGYGVELTHDGLTLTYLLFGLPRSFFPWVGLVSAPPARDAALAETLPKGRFAKWSRWAALEAIDASFVNPLTAIENGQLAQAVLADARRHAVASMGDAV